MDYYIANSGDDNNNGTTLQYPWRTISKVNIEMNTGNIHPGDCVFFKRGDLFNDARLEIRIHGTSANPIIFSAYGTGEKPILSNVGDFACYGKEAGNIIIEKLTLSDSYGAIKFLHSSNIVFRDINAVNISSNEAITLQGLTNVSFDNIQTFNTVHSIRMRYCDNYVIENSVLYPNHRGGHGISIGAGTSNGIIRDCICHDCKDGINIHYEEVPVGNNHLIERVTVYNTAEEGFDLVGGLGCKNIEVRDCEAYNSIHGMVIGWHQSDVIVDNFYSHDHPTNDIVITDAHNVLIKNSFFEKPTKYAVVLYGIDNNQLCDNIQFVNNIITNDEQSTRALIAIGQYAGGPYISNILFENNIFLSQNPTNRFIWYKADATPENTNSRFINNTWWRTNANPEPFALITALEAKDFNWWNAQYPTDRFEQPTQCTEGTTCFGNDLYECQNGFWRIIEHNSSQCMNVQEENIILWILLPLICVVGLATALQIKKAKKV